MRSWAFVAAIALGAAACSSTSDAGPSPVDPSPVDPVTAPVATTTPTTPPIGSAPALPDDDATTSFVTGPEGAAFYTPPTPLPGDAPGDLIWARPLDASPDGTVGWLVLYRSESVAGEPIAVSGTVIAPATPSGADVVLSWAHGTTGMGDQCAPSALTGSGFSAESIVAGIAAARGWTFVATDYEGLGTAGVHPYLVGISEGRGVLDIVRAAQQLPGSGASTTSKVAIFGHSQGGHAALMAAELAPAYAPELDVVGTVAGAPPGDLARIAAAPPSGNPESAGFRLMMKAGFLAAYPDLDPAAAVDSAVAPLLVDVAAACSDEAFDLASTISTPQPDPSLDPAWAAALDDSSPGATAPSGPVLIFHGDADTTVPSELSLGIRDAYCSLGATVQRTVYPGQDHVGVVLAAIGEIQTWIIDRLAGEPAPDNCADQQAA